MKRADLIPTRTYKKAIEQYGIGTLTDKNGNPVNGPTEARQIAANLSGQSYSDALKSRKKADRFGIAKKNEIAEGERSSSAY